MQIKNHKQPEGFLEALSHCGYAIRFNVRSEDAEILRDGYWIAFNDRIAAKVRFEIARKCHYIKGDKESGAAKVPLLYSTTLFYDLRDACLADMEGDPFKDWLNALEPLQINNDAAHEYQLEVDQYLIKLFSVPASTYYRHCSRAILLSAVWRAYHPGYKIDEIVVLQGPQGAGKDSVIRSLLPDGSFFTDSLAFNASDKEKIEITRSKVFVCASEMGGVTTTKDLEALKRWITSQSDRTRMAYRRDADDMLRRFVVIGTTNSDRPLPADATGNRRWLVVPLKHGAHVEPFIEGCRDLLWREAIALYKKGFRPNLPFEMKKQQEEENIRRTRSDDQIEDAYDSALINGKIGGNPMQMSSLAWLLGLCDGPEDWPRAPKMDQHRLRDVLIGRKWVQRRCRIDGESRQWWLPPNYLDKNKKP